jgi:hypothetical protein
MRVGPPDLTDPGETDLQDHRCGRVEVDRLRRQSDSDQGARRAPEALEVDKRAASCPVRGRYRIATSHRSYRAP